MMMFCELPTDEKMIFENCKCAYFNDAIYVYNAEGDYLGTICTNPEDWDLIKAGHNPISERWEDGAGNTCSLNGWGN